MSSAHGRVSSSHGTPGQMVAQFSNQGESRVGGGWSDNEDVLSMLQTWPVSQFITGQPATAAAAAITPQFVSQYSGRW